MIRTLIVCLVLVLPLQAIAGGEGVVSKQSRYAVPATLDRLEAVLPERKITVFARIDHGGEAIRAGLQMRPAQLLIFGNPRAGTPLMKASPTAAVGRSGCRQSLIGGVSILPARGSAEDSLSHRCWCLDLARCHHASPRAG